jgi:hypothetical protein
MNCERCQTELEDLLYGELNERQAAEMRAHLSGCAECAAVRDDLERENELFAQFYERTAIEPSGEAWEAIRSRISAETLPRNEVQISEKPTWWQSLFGGWLNPLVLRQAALALLLIAVSVAATVWLMKRNDNGKNIAETNSTPTPQMTALPNVAPSPNRELAQTAPEKNVQTVAPAQAQPRPSAVKADSPSGLSDRELLNRQLARAEREYQNAIKMLDVAITKRRNGIEPEAFKQYESSLALINNSIAQSKTALRERPDDLAAGQFLLAAYAKKVELMQTIAMN